MRITNKFNLPEPLVLLITKISKEYDPGESYITATGLLKPPQMRVLEKLHDDEIVVDVTELIHSVVGTSIHSMLESCGKELSAEHFIVEERFYIEVDGKKIGAKIDLFHIPSGTLYDYKNTSVYSVKDGMKEEYAKQLNIGAECLRQNGYEVKALKINALLRDWRKGEYERDEFGNYPEVQFKELECDVIPSAEVLAYIRSRLSQHLDAEAGKSIPCSKEERWAKPDMFAVMKKGQKRALRLFNTEEGAKLFLAEQDKSCYIETRFGQNTRCESYCSVKFWCSQYKALKKENE